MEQVAHASSRFYVLSGGGRACHDAFRELPTGKAIWCVSPRITDRYVLYQRPIMYRTLPSGALAASGSPFSPATAGKRGSDPAGAPQNGPAVESLSMLAVWAQDDICNNTAMRSKRSRCVQTCSKRRNPECRTKPGRQICRIAAEACGSGGSNVPAGAIRN